MELWELISMLCQKVVEEQNCYLDIIITNNGWNIQLMPIGDDWEDEEDED